MTCHVVIIFLYEMVCFVHEFVSKTIFLHINAEKCIINLLSVERNFVYRLKVSFLRHTLALSRYHVVNTNTALQNKQNVYCFCASLKYYTVASRYISVRSRTASILSVVIFMFMSVVKFDVSQLNGRGNEYCTVVLHQRTCITVYMSIVSNDKM